MRWDGVCLVDAWDGEIGGEVGVGLMAQGRKWRKGRVELKCITVLESWGSRHHICTILGIASALPL